MLEGFLRWFGFGLCHQLPERSFFGGPYQVPVCARDTGIYIGLAVSAALLFMFERRRRSSELPRWPLMVLLAAFVVSMGVDGVTSYAGLRQTTNDIRLLTGLGTGYAMAAVLVPMLNGEMWRRAGMGHVLSDARESVPWLASLPVLFALVRWVLPFTGIVYSLLVVVAILLSFGLVNLLIVSLAPPLDRKAARLRELWLQISLAFVLTVAELAIAAGLRSWLFALLANSA